jgi:hypothetical protein
MENKLIELSLYERSKLHVAMIDALGCSGNSARERGRAAWCWQVTHLHFDDVAENIRTAEHILDVVADCGGSPTVFSIELPELKALLKTDTTTTVNALELLGCAERECDPNIYETKSALPRSTLTLPTTTID